MSKRYFEFVEGTSSKFWEIWREGSSVNTRYGRIGASGQTTIKTEKDEASAEKLWSKLVAEKTKKGYIEKGGTPAPKGAASAGPAPAAKKASPAAKPAAGAAAAPASLKGKSVVITGTFARPRKELEKLLQAAGCMVGGSVTAKTDVLLVGTDAGSKLAAAQKLGVKIMTEAEFDSAASSSGPAQTVPGPKAKAAEWQVYADQLQASGDPRGEVIALQLAIEAKPADAKLRDAERAALKPLLSAPLSDFVARFDAMVEKLKKKSSIKQLAYFKHEPVTEKEIIEVETKLGVPLHQSILTFFRQTNGIQFYAEDTEHEEYEETDFKPLTGKYDKKAKDQMSRFSENFQIAHGLSIPTLKEVFLSDFEGILWFDHQDDENQAQFGRKSFPELSFHKSLRVLDEHNGYYVIAFALIDQPANPRIGLGDDHGVGWDSTKTVDFETYMNTVIKNEASTEKMTRFFSKY
ncbi:MAG: WGR domain-containing protein [Archangium sp.]|nr:WGR domain-containing protein [Archangium sp.]